MALLQHSSDHITNAIISAAIEVHRTIGPGVLESTYHKCLGRELVLREIPFESAVKLPLEYKGITLDQAYVIDLLGKERLSLNSNVSAGSFQFMNANC